MPRRNRPRNECNYAARRQSFLDNGTSVASPWRTTRICKGDIRDSCFAQIERETNERHIAISRCRRYAWLSSAHFHTSHVWRVSVPGSEWSGHGTGTGEYHVHRNYHIRRERLQGTATNLKGKKSRLNVNLFSHLHSKFLIVKSPRKWKHNHSWKKKWKYFTSWKRVTIFTLFRVHFKGNLTPKKVRFHSKKRRASLFLRSEISLHFF